MGWGWGCVGLVIISVIFCSSGFFYLASDCFFLSSSFSVCFFIALNALANNLGFMFYSYFTVISIFVNWMS
jgi:hypothetical protein